MLSGAPSVGSVLRGELTGDVDGDGRVDRASVVYARGAPDRCESVLRVERADGIATRVVRAGVSPETRSSVSHDAPRLTALAPLDGRPGAELLVTVWDGASTSFGALYSVRSGRLVRMHVPRSSIGAAGVLPYSGSLGHTSALQCRRGRAGLVSVSAAKVPAGWDVARFALVPKGDGFSVKSEPARRVESLPPEFAGAPLSGCAVASNPR
jgi:hypothetical protein